MDLFFLPLKKDLRQETQCYSKRAWCTKSQSSLMKHLGILTSTQSVPVLAPVHLPPQRVCGPNTAALRLRVAVTFRYVTIRFQTRRDASSHHNRNRAEINVVMCEHEPHRVGARSIRMIIALD